MVDASCPRMNPEQLRERTSIWATEVGRLAGPLFRNFETRHRASQLKDAADSCASNYRAACVARSRREFIAKISIALEEADETVGWLEMSHREGILRGDATLKALDEARQLTRILAKSRDTAEENEQKAKERARRRKLRDGRRAPDDQ